MTGVCSNWLVSQLKPKPEHIPLSCMLSLPSHTHPTHNTTLKKEDPSPPLPPHVVVGLQLVTYVNTSHIFLIIRQARRTGSRNSSAIRFLPHHSTASRDFSLMKGRQGTLVDPLQGGHSGDAWQTHDYHFWPQSGGKCFLVGLHVPHVSVKHHPVTLKLPCTNLITFLLFWIIR